MTNINKQQALEALDKLTHSSMCDEYKTVRQFIESVDSVDLKDVKLCILENSGCIRNIKSSRYKFQNIEMAIESIPDTINTSCQCGELKSQLETEREQVQHFKNLYDAETVFHKDAVKALSDERAAHAETKDNYNVFVKEAEEQRQELLRTYEKLKIVVNERDDESDAHTYTAVKLAELHKLNSELIERLAEYEQEPLPSRDDLMSEMESIRKSLVKHDLPVVIDDDGESIRICIEDPITGDTCNSIYKRYAAPRKIQVGDLVKFENTENDCYVFRVKSINSAGHYICHGDIRHSSKFITPTGYRVNSVGKIVPIRSGDCA